MMYYYERDLPSDVLDARLPKVNRFIKGKCNFTLELNRLG